MNSYELTGLEAGACYEVRVRATQQVEGTWYYDAYSRTIRRAMVNTTLQGRASKSLIRLTIGEVAGADQYQIIYADNAAMTNAKSIKTSKLSVTIRNLKAGKKYYFRVRPLFKDGKKTYMGVRSSRYAFKTKK